MRSLANLTEDGTGEGWQSVDKIILGYGDWIKRKRQEATGLDGTFAAVAARHLDACDRCLKRITDGVTLLRSDARVRRAFRLANLAMLLQQIGTKQVNRRPLTWDAANRRVVPSGGYQSPSEIYEGNLENPDRVGSWRAFQIAFLLMSLHGVRDGQSSDRNIVDLIWFPTGGGKTEAYLGVMAFYMFHERLLMEGDTGPRRDGTNVLMRYTLRMLTTQQFQRAASLICSMEYLRRNPSKHLDGNIPGHRFSLGLWIGSDGSPNKVRDAKIALRSSATETPKEIRWFRTWTVLELSASYEGKSNVAKIDQIYFAADGTTQTGRDTIYLQTNPDGTIHQYDAVGEVLKRFPENHPPVYFPTPKKLGKG